MNYQKIYDDLISRAFARDSIEGYTEKHHIVPKCMGGTDDKENIAVLTAREHYVAHLLLVKIYPESIKLSFAACKMTAGFKTRTKIVRNNRMYAWLKEAHSKNITKTQTGKIYYNNGIKNIKLFPDEDIPTGFVKGRSFSPTKGKPHGEKRSDSFSNKSLQSELVKRRWDKDRQKILTAFNVNTMDEVKDIILKFRE